MSVWRLSPASFEFALQSLTKPWLSFDHFPACALSSACTLPSHIAIVSRLSCLSLHVFPLPCFISISPSWTFLLPRLSFPPLPFLWTYPLWCLRSRERERHIRLKIKSAGCCVSTWIPTHLVIAVSEPSDNSLNCLPSNLWWDWGGDGSLKKKRKEKQREMTKGVRKARGGGAQKDVVAKHWKEELLVHCASKCRWTQRVNYVLWKVRICVMRCRAGVISPHTLRKEARDGPAISAALINIGDLHAVRVLR